MKKRVVAFCGAGLSVGAGIPAMASFGDRLRHSSALDAVDLADFDHIQANCNDLAAVVGASARNLEQLTSFISVLRLSRPAFQFEKCQRSRTLDAAMALVLRAIHGVYSPAFNEYRQNAHSLCFLCHEHDLTVITTNYDLNIEISAAQHHFRIAMVDSLHAACASATAPDAEVPSIYDTPSWSKIKSMPFLRLLKLHGSVNWYTCGDLMFVDDRWTPTAYQLRPPDGSGGPTQWELSPWQNRPDWVSPENSLVVAPTVLKPGMLQLLKDQWEHAGAALQCADILVFIGYSFPASDTFMRFFLASALYDNPRLERIVVIDPDVLNTLSLAAPFLTHPSHRDILVPVPFEWEKSPLADIVAGRWRPSGQDPIIKEAQSRLQAQYVLRGQLPAHVDPEIRNVGFRGRGRF
jgi:hypothetical protein